MATRLYEILEVQATATAEEIRKAYKKRALKTHPDRLGPAVTPEEKKSAEEQFREVNQAYEILTDVEKRKEYDLHGQWPPPSAPRPSPSQGRRPHMQVYEEFDDPFSHPFFQNHNHEQFRSFAFTDPFTLFESIFGNAAGSRQSGGPTYTTSTSFNFNDPFTLNADRHTASDPFVSFPPFGGIFGALPGSMSTGGFGGQTFGAGSSNGQWASESFSTQTINGVTHTVHTRRDWEGNDHVTQMHGNGHETYTINGVEQTSQPQLQNQPMNSQPLPSARPNRQSSRDSAHFAPSQRQRASYQPQYDTQYSLPPQQSYSNQQPQYQTRNEPQIYVDYDSGFPSTSSEGKRRRDSHRSERPSHDTSRAHHHQHPASQHPNKSKGILSSVWDRLNSRFSSAIHHGGANSTTK